MAISVTIDPKWNIVNKIRNEILTDNDIKNLSSELIDATIVTGIELLENSLRYSEQNVEKDTEINFSIKIVEKDIIVKISNYCSNLASINKVKEIIDELKINDPFELYVNRMQEIQSNSDGFSRLGLLRIAYEGEFYLSYHINENIITIIAKREIK